MYANRKLLDTRQQRKHFTCIVSNEDRRQDIYIYTKSSYAAWSHVLWWKGHNCVKGWQKLSTNSKDHVSKSIREWPAVHTAHIDVDRGRIKLRHQLCHWVHLNSILVMQRPPQVNSKSIWGSLPIHILHTNHQLGKDPLPSCCQPMGLLLKGVHIYSQAVLLER